MSAPAGVLEALRRASSWEAATLAVAQGVFGLLVHESALTPVRLLVFRRPTAQDGSVDAAAHIPFPIPGAPRLPDATRLSPSMSLWRALLSERRPVLARRHPPEYLSLFAGSRAQGQPGPSAVEAGVGTTHALALPILTEAVEGMVVVEARVSGGDALPSWRRVEPELSELVTAAAAYLLRARPGEAARSGLLNLPVPAAPALAQSLRLLDRVAELDEPILLTGPTGVGKSQLAAAAHRRSRRAARPFVSANLIAIPPELRLGYLYGWRRGAFTGSEAEHRGFVGEAEGGTLFLDEIDKLGLGEQQALLEFLETRTYRRLRDDGAQRADVRIIAATNADLHTLMERKQFLEDLYARICTFSFRVPPLHERRTEIVPWAEHFLGRIDQKYGTTTTLSRESAGALEAAPWPRNLRELEQAVLKAWLLCRPEDEPGAEARVLVRHVHQALAWDRVGGSASALDLDEVLPSLVRAARGLLAAERQRPHEDFWAIVDGALRAAVTLEGLQDPPDQRVDPIQTFFDQRNAKTRRQRAEELLDQLRRWLGGDQSSS